MKLFNKDKCEWCNEEATHVIRRPNNTESLACNKHVTSYCVPKFGHILELLPIKRKAA